MDKEVMIALIGACATVVAALIGLVTVQRHNSAPTRSPGDKRPRRGWRPTRNVRAVALVGVVVVALGVMIVAVWSSSAGCRTFVPLTVTSSTEKDELLDELAREYVQRAQAQDGYCAQVTVSPVSSGDAMEGLVQGWGTTDYTNGKPPPQVWMPTSSMWVRQYEKLRNLNQPYSSVTRSQVVIAVPRSIALALGWPGKTLSWKDLRDLATNAEPWKLYPGLPAGEPFKLRKDNPKYSTSGLASTVAAYYAGAKQLGLGGGLAEAVAHEGVVSFVRSLESGMEYTHDAMDQLAEIGRHDQQGTVLKYLSGIVMQEELVYLYNARDSEVFRGDRPNTLHEPLHVFYPQDGLLELDHPYAVLSRDSAVEAAAESFRRYLMDERQQQRFLDRGFRDARTNELSAAARTTMNIPSGPLPRYTEVPPAEPLIRILSDIDRLRRKARVLLVLDVSGSMREAVGGAKPKIDLVKDAVKAALRQLNPNDEVGLMVFSDRRELKVDIGPLATVLPRLNAAVDQMTPSGNTALYDTIRAATERMAGAREVGWVNAVVVLTDGADTAYPGREAEARALAKLTADLQQRELTVPVFTIGFGLNVSTKLDCESLDGEDPEPREAREALQAISSASYGSCFNAAATSPTYINKVFVDVFRHF
jgi:Ca-activated chloride channel homolog